MSSSTPAVTAPGVQDLSKITTPAPEADKNETAIGLLGKLKDYVLDHKAGVANLLQVGGSASLALGGTALLFTGVASILTVSGTPLGVPLLIAGGIILGVGTIFKIAEKVQKNDSTTGEKIKEFFKDTLSNIIKGTALGGAFLGLCKVVPLSTLVLVAPVAIKLIPSLNADLNNPDEWKKFVTSFPPESTIGKLLKDTKTLDDFIEKKLGILKIVKGGIELFEPKEEKPSIVTNSTEKEETPSPAKEPEISEKSEAKAEEKNSGSVESTQAKSQGQEDNSGRQEEQLPTEKSDLGEKLVINGMAVSVLGTLVPPAA